MQRWAALPVDKADWAKHGSMVESWRRQDPDRAAMVTRSAMVAAAFQSAVLDGVVAGDRRLADSLAAGQTSLATLDDEVRRHVRANWDAMELARDAPVTETTIRRIHALACAPQLTHEVLVEGRVQDHVMAHGDYKHHPNHIRLDGGGWKPTAPVALVRPEMARLVDIAGSPEFAALHPVAQAGWLQHAVLHVQPFADGNGRVARALASGVLLRTAGVPLLAFGEADDILAAVMVLVGLLWSVDTLDWRTRSAAGEELRRQLVPALQDAFRRTNPPRRADITHAYVGPDLVIRVPGTEVVETLELDAHPLDDGPVSVVAREAGLRLVAGGLVEAWAERVATVLALRVAAEQE